MSKKLNYAMDAGLSINVKVDGIDVVDIASLQNRTLIVGTEYRLITAGKTVIATIDGIERLNYTVPDGRVLLIETLETIVDE